MKSGFLSLVLAAVTAMSLMTACGDKSESSAGKKEGPIISIESVNANVGEIVEVSVSVEGADNNWQMCGIHMTYDDRLECVATDDDPMVPDYEQGDAVADMTAFVTRIWLENKDDELINNDLGCLFFTTMGEGDCGRDGVIATYKFKVPDDAQAGEFYELGFYYREGDIFINTASDEKLQEQAFSNWESGFIRIGPVPGQE